MEIRFQCPECKGNAVVQMTEKEAFDVKERIQREGRSPTIIVQCENNHELLITLFNQRDGKGLGVRDVVVPQRAGSDEEKEGTGSKEIDWLTKAFGGDN